MSRLTLALAVFAAAGATAFAPGSAHRASAEVAGGTDPLYGLLLTSQGGLQSVAFVPDSVSAWSYFRDTFGFMDGNPGPVQPGVVYAADPPLRAVGEVYADPLRESNLTLVLAAQFRDAGHAHAWFDAMDHCSAGETRSWVSWDVATVLTVETASHDPVVLQGIEVLVGLVRDANGLSDACRAA